MISWRSCDHCGRGFYPAKVNQRFCCPDHKRAWWRDFYQAHAHACPLCSMRHHPHWQRGAKAPPLERDGYGVGEAGGAGGGP